MSCKKVEVRLAQMNGGGVDGRKDQIFARAIEAAGDDGWDQYIAYVGVLLKEEDYIPQYDNAIRDWAHSSKRTAEVLKEIEAFRIQRLHHVFLALGFTGRAAQVRA